MTINSTNENDCEMKRIEVINDELDRLHKLAHSTDYGWKERREWAFARIEELQAMLVASQFIVTDTDFDSEEMN